MLLPDELMYLIFEYSSLRTLLNVREFFDVEEMIIDRLEKLKLGFNGNYINESGDMFVYGTILMSLPFKVVEFTSNNIYIDTEGTVWKQHQSILHGYISVRYFHDHLLLLNDKGEIYVYNLNTSKLQKVLHVENVTKIDANNEYMYALNSKGILYYFNLDLKLNYRDDIKDFAIITHSKNVIVITIDRHLIDGNIIISGIYKRVHSGMFKATAVDMNDKIYEIFMGHKEYIINNAYTGIVSDNYYIITIDGELIISNLNKQILTKIDLKN